MKKMFYFAAAAALVLSGCEKEPSTPSLRDALTAPEIVSVVNNITDIEVEWTAVENAGEYEYTLGDIHDKTKNTKIALAGIELNEELQFTLKALPADAKKYSESESVSTTIFTGLMYGGENYKIVVLKDDNVWMAENLRYIPEGMSISPADDFTANTGIWYPCTVTKNASGQYVAAAATDEATIKANGYFYSNAVALGVDVLDENNYNTLEGTQGICPKGWHIPTFDDWFNLIGYTNNAKIEPNISAPYYDASKKGANFEPLNEDGFNLLPVSYVNGGNAYANNVLNVTEGAYMYNMPSMSYFACSTGYTSTTTSGNTNRQMYNLLAMNMAAAANTKIVVGYSNFPNGISVRCVKDKK